MKKTIKQMVIFILAVSISLIYGNIPASAQEENYFDNELIKEERIRNDGYLSQS